MGIDHRAAGAPRIRQHLEVMSLLGSLGFAGGFTG